MANYNGYFKNNFNHLAMNVTEVNFLYWQNVHIWHLVEVNHKKKFVVHSIFTGYKR